MRRERLGLQLFTLRDLTAEDMAGTLRRVAAMGYRAVEFAGYGDSTPTGVRAVLDEVGLVAVAAHVPFDDWRVHREEVLGDLTDLGVAYGVVPAVPAELRKDADAVAELATLLNRWGAECRAHGLRLAYHNHEKEFTPVGGRTVWEALVAATDPEFVTFELDIYWAAVGGADPVSLLRLHADRIALLHAKDLLAGDPPVDAPAGRGILPWEEIVAAPGASSRWYLVEQDTSDAPLQDVEHSLRFLDSLADPA